MRVIESLLEQHTDREAKRLAELRRQMKEQDERRYKDPDADAELERIWVVYAWRSMDDVPMKDVPDATTWYAGGRWELAGFVRRRSRRRPQSWGRFFARVRRKTGVERGVPVKVTTLQTAMLRVKRGDTKWIHEPPARHKSTRPAPAKMAPVVRAKKAPRRRFTRAPLAYTARVTQFVALGKRLDYSSHLPLYLGPLAATTREEAIREAQELFGCIWSPIVVGVKEMSAKLRGRIRRGKTVRPGVTRLLWPEPPALSEFLTYTDAELARVPRTSVEALIKSVEKELKYDLKELTSQEEENEGQTLLITHAAIEYGLAALGFLYDELDRIRVNSAAA